MKPLRINCLFALWRKKGSKKEFVFNWAFKRILLQQWFLNKNEKRINIKKICDSTSQNVCVMDRLANRKLWWVLRIKAFASYLILSLHKFRAVCIVTKLSRCTLCIGLQDEQRKECTGSDSHIGINENVEHSSIFSWS